MSRSDLLSSASRRSRSCMRRIGNWQRQKLFEVLSEYGIRGGLEAIKSIYVGSEAAVRIDGEMSEAFEVEEGVRQGCCLSPLLFIIFMDKIIRQANIEGNIEVVEVIMNMKI